MDIPTDKRELESKLKDIHKQLRKVLARRNLLLARLQRQINRKQEINNIDDTRQRLKIVEDVYYPLLLFKRHLEEKVAEKDV